MAELKNRQWLVAERPRGLVRESDFQWNETVVPPLKDGQVLIRNLMFSFDPAQVGWMTMDTYVPVIPLGQVMRASAGGQVIESKRPGFAKGDLVQGIFGWEDYTVSDGVEIKKLKRRSDLSVVLSLYGITGLAAYFGTVVVGRPKKSETFVVSGAAGSVGSVAGMIAKIRGSRVVGIDGGQERCDWLIKEAGFDAVIDYKQEDVGAALSHTCPAGIDVYFDNVGGETLDLVLERINLGARIVLCGGTSRFGEEKGVFGYGPKKYFNLVFRSARMEGFIVFHFAKRFPKAISDLSRWYKEGKIKGKVEIHYGLEKAPKTLIRLFTGLTFGKQLLNLGDPQ